RPLLSFTRDRILAYARANGIIWREDSTNGDSDYKRNRLRNEVFPLLAKINPSFIETLNREMRHFSSAADIVERNCPRLIREGRLDIHDLLWYEHWPYLLYILLEPYGFDGATLSSIETLLRDSCHTDNRPAKGTTLSGKIFHSELYTLYTTSTELVITEKSAHHHSSQVTITKQGDYSVDNMGFNVEMIDREQLASLKPPKGTLYLDAGIMPFPFIVRHWSHGDWIRPFGMEGRRKKVSDLFVDLKYDTIDKANSLFAVKPGEDKKHVYALLGERIDEAVKVTPATTKILKITLL
ncbi:MAG: tRNA lysidine(34) synthetase TilS, partial [Bacteroidales bacterium]|nr:tRNA lysidine(34) synthetase TilS [Bacteroidales bacterium]